MGKLRELINKARPSLLGGLIPEGKIGLKLIGYRNYVGGMWDEIGDLQFKYIVSQGMRPEHCFLDVGCGALRGGWRFIDYLESGNYLGFDKEKELIKIGKKKVLTKKLLEEKSPEFVISDNFEFEGFSKKPEYAIALSLFTHLNRDDIVTCLTNLKKFVKKDHKFFATFFEGKSIENPGSSHSLDHFDYTRNEMIEFGKIAGWKSEYIGDWDHPRDQKMMKYTA